MSPINERNAMMQAKRKALVTVDGKLGGLAESRAAKDEEMKDLERTLVQVLVEQQKKLLSLLSEVGLLGHSTLLLWPCPSSCSRKAGLKQSNLLTRPITLFVVAVAREAAELRQRPLSLDVLRLNLEIYERLCCEDTRTEYNKLIFILRLCSKTGRQVSRQSSCRK